MSEETNFSIRLSKAAKEFNVGKDTIVEFLSKKGFQVDSSQHEAHGRDVCAAREGIPGREGSEERGHEIGQPLLQGR